MSKCATVNYEEPSDDEPRTLVSLDELLDLKRVEVIDLERGFFKIVHPPESLYSPLPETEVELFRLQNVLLANPRETEVFAEARSDMFILMVNYVKSLIQQKLKGMGKHIDPDEITEMANATVMNHIQSHYGTNQFKVVWVSFAGLFKYSIFGVLCWRGVKGE